MWRHRNSVHVHESRKKEASSYLRALDCPEIAFAKYQRLSRFFGPQRKKTMTWEASRTARPLLRHLGSHFSPCLRGSLQVMPSRQSLILRRWEDCQVSHHNCPRLFSSRFLAILFKSMAHVPWSRPRCTVWNIFQTNKLTDEHNSHLRIWLESSDFFSV